MKINRFIGFVSPLGVILSLAGNVMAQTSNDFLLGASTGSAVGGGTGSSLPNAGSTEFTYIIFAGGAILFVVGMLKMILSYRNSN